MTAYLSAHCQPSAHGYFEQTRLQIRLLGNSELSQKGAFDGKRKTIELSQSYIEPSRADQVKGHCRVFVDIYKPPMITEEEESNLTRNLDIALISLMVIVVLSFCGYDRIVQKRQSKVIDAARRSTTIVDSLFPSNVRDRILEDRAVVKKPRKKTSVLNGFLFGDEKGIFEQADGGSFKSKPIADLFPETTVLVSELNLIDFPGNIKAGTDFSLLSVLTP